MIAHLTLRNFKKIRCFDSDLEKINILVGANNSGKSSVLQGIQFTLMAEVARRYYNRDTTVPQEKLFYLPSADFTILRNGSQYTNYSGNTSELSLIEDGNSAETFSVVLKKGRNYGNISVTPSANNKFRQTVTSFVNLYSTYTPGLSGISLREKMVGKAVLRNAAANGDANLYLRNIIYYVNENNKLNELNKLIEEVFCDTKLVVRFDPDNDTDILVEVESLGRTFPIELCGTGLLQVIQIMAYSLYFQPKLLLLDEPDEHLHPNNQRLLSKALQLLVDKYDLQIILSTHSRHMIVSMESCSRIIWMKGGTICKEKIDPSYYNLLFDLGALDTFDDVIQGVYKNVILTEDSDTINMETLLRANSVDLNKTLIYSYKTCGQIESAILMGEFIKKAAPNCNVIIHRDRDFMTNEEVKVVSEKITARGLVPWVTLFSDIEAYFTTKEHLAVVTGRDEKCVQDWVDFLIAENHVDIQTAFINKRNEIKKMMYHDGKLKQNISVDYPDSTGLFGKTIPTDVKNVKGKLLLRKLNGDVIRFCGRAVKINVISHALVYPDIKSLIV